MQVNSRWLPKLAGYGISRDMLFDPCTNINVGAWVLANEFYRHGASWSSVGRYNSPNPAISSNYVGMVRGIFTSIRATYRP